MRWAVQWAVDGSSKNVREWRTVDWRESRAEAVERLKSWRATRPATYRLVRLVTKSEKLRAKIVEELRAAAKGPVKIMSAWEAQLNAACEVRILEMANRIERGEVG